MTRLTTSRAKRDFDDTLKRVTVEKERIILHRGKKNVAAVVPIEDLVRLEQLEDQQDAQDARDILEHDEFVPYEEVRKRLGL